jgi:hypothetical protein
MGQNLQPGLSFTAIIIPYLRLHTTGLMTPAGEDPITRGMTRQDAFARIGELQRSRPNSAQGGFATTAGGGVPGGGGWEPTFRDG